MAIQILNGASPEVATTTAIYAWWNNVAACLILIPLISISTFILLKGKTILKHMKYAIGIYKLLDVAFSVLFVLACPVRINF